MLVIKRKIKEKTEWAHTSLRFFLSIKKQNPHLFESKKPLPRETIDKFVITLSERTILVR